MPSSPSRAHHPTILKPLHPPGLPQPTVPKINLVDSLQLYRQKGTLQQKSNDPIRLKTNSSHTRSSRLILNTNLTTNSYQQPPSIMTPRNMFNNNSDLHRKVLALERNQQLQSERMDEIQQALNILKNK